MNIQKFAQSVAAYSKQRSTTSIQILETRLDLAVRTAESLGFEVRLMACGGANVVLVPDSTRMQQQTLLYASPAHFVDAIKNL